VTTSARLDLRGLVVDNHDSYTYNLVQAFAELTRRQPLVVCNDECDWGELEGEDVDFVVISPGPGRPQRPADLGLSAAAIRDGRLPLLGVCLGHQAIAYLNGGAVVEAPTIVHGGRSPIVHRGDALFGAIPSGFHAVRYHSLVATRLPPQLEEIAWAPDGTVMALRHRAAPQWGVQFHPESVATEHGPQLLVNFLRLARRLRGERRRAARPAPRPRAAPARTPRALQLFTRTLPLTASPEAVFRQLFGDAEHSFWLDRSLGGPGLAPFSYLGSVGGPRASVASYSVADRCVTLTHAGRTERLEASVFDYLDETLAAWAVRADVPWDFHGGLVGYLGYEAKADVGASAAHRSPDPDAVFFFVDRFVVVDHERDELQLVAVDDAGARGRAEAWLDETAAALDHVAERPPPRPARRAGLATPFEPDLDAPAYLRAIEACHEELRRGESYEICLTTQLRARCAVEPLELYTVLRRVNPAPYAAFLHAGDLDVLCSSPERFLTVDRHGRAETKPIKGTAPRSQDRALDAAAAASLRDSPKTIAENLMITDVLRNDLGRVAAVGTVEVPVFLGVESYATVHQLVSTVRARLGDGRTAVDCLRAMFPGGSMTGAPRLRTMEIIDRLEPAARGVYSGALGFLSLSGAADLGMVIRTIVCSRDDLSIGVGGAITIDSDPEEELAEAMLKAHALIRSVELAAGAEPFVEAALAR
jgi:para-aminobenzoate synthetase